LRLALKLAQMLGTNPGRDDLIDRYAPDAVSRILRLRRVFDLHQLAVARGWTSAAANVRARLLSEAVELRHLLGYIQSDAPPRRIVATAGQIYTDLGALAEEFDDLSIAADLSSVSVITDPITLDGIALGRFQIHLDLTLMGSRRADSSQISAIALDPNSATRDDSVTHPHVQSETICFGDGASAVNAAISEGRLYDVFSIVNAVLHTYNDGSPYISLESWYGQRCEDCDDIVDGDMTSCQRCDRQMCSDCQGSCNDCEDSYCCRCLEPDDGDLVCPSCLEQRQHARDIAEAEAEEAEDDEFDLAAVIVDSPASSFHPLPETLNESTSTQSVSPESLSPQFESRQFESAQSRALPAGVA
jgi:hypothetical protein